MKLQKIKFEKFKNLKEIDIDCKSHNGLTVIIGNNASGKSNFLEALSNMLYSQYTKTKSAWDFELSYKDFKDKKITLKSSPFKSELPKRVVAVYSGEEDRLWRTYYENIYKKYIREITGDKAIEFPKMLYLNKFYWHISLLCLLCSEAADVKEFIRTKLGITSVKSITFKKQDPKFKNSTVKSFTDGLNKTYTLSKFKEATKDESELFLKLFIAFTDADNKLIDDIVITYNKDQTIADLSEGQKKQLLIKAALEFAGQEDTLFLLDEPDAHIHISNKKSILDIIKPYVNNRHIILTTHSPTLCKFSPKTSILFLQDGKYLPVENEFQAAKYLVDNDDILKLLFSTKDIIIVEGKTDDKYLSKAIDHFKGEFPELDFDFLRVGGTDDENIKNLLEKIEPNPMRKIIILVDRDDAGLKVYRKLFPLSKKERKDIAIELYKPNTYFIMIPHKTAGNQQGDFLIEDYFSNKAKRDLTKKLIDDKFTDTTPFKDFPAVKDRLKTELLPDYCLNSKPEDMADFKHLLTKLKEIILKPIS